MSRHLIDDMVFDIAFEGDDTELAGDERLGALLRERLLPVVGEVLDQHDDAQAVTSFDTLELDLGEIPGDDFAHEIVLRLRAALDDELKRRQLAAPTRAPQPRRRTEAERLLGFLRTGRLPWHVDDADAHAHEAALDGLLDGPAEPLLRMLAAAIAEPHSARRLVRQFSEPQLQAILRRAAPREADRLQAVASALGALARRHGVGSADALHEAIWRGVLAAALAGGFSEARLPALIASVVSELVALAGPRGPVLLPTLAQEAAALSGWRSDGSATVAQEAATLGGWRSDGLTADAPALASGLPIAAGTGGAQPDGSKAPPASGVRLPVAADAGRSQPDGLPAPATRASGLPISAGVNDRRPDGSTSREPPAIASGSPIAIRAEDQRPEDSMSLTPPARTSGLPIAAGADGPRTDGSTSRALPALASGLSIEGDVEDQRPDGSTSRVSPTFAPGLPITVGVDGQRPDDSASPASRSLMAAHATLVGGQSPTPVSDEQSATSVRDKESIDAASLDYAPAHLRHADAPPDAATPTALPSNLRDRVARALLGGDAAALGADWPLLMRDHASLLRAALRQYGHYPAVREMLSLRLPESMFVELVELLDPQAGELLTIPLLSPARFQSSARLTGAAAWEGWKRRLRQAAADALLAGATPQFDLLADSGALLRRLAGPDPSHYANLLDAWIDALPGAERYDGVAAALESLQQAAMQSQRTAAAERSTLIVQSYDLANKLRRRLEQPGDENDTGVTAGLAGALAAHPQRLLEVADQLDAQGALLQLVRALAIGNARASLLAAVEVAVPGAADPVWFLRTVAGALVRGEQVDLDAILARDVHGNAGGDPAGAIARDADLRSVARGHAADVVRGVDSHRAQGEHATDVAAYGVDSHGVMGGYATDVAARGTDSRGVISDHAADVAAYDTDSHGAAGGHAMDVAADDADSPDLAGTHAASVHARGADLLTATGSQAAHVAGGAGLNDPADGDAADLAAYDINLHGVVDAGAEASGAHAPISPSTQPQVTDLRALVEQYLGAGNAEHVPSLLAAIETMAMEAADKPWYMRTVSAALAAHAELDLDAILARDAARQAGGQGRSLSLGAPPDDARLHGAQAVDDDARADDHQTTDDTNLFGAAGGRAEEPIIAPAPAPSPARVEADLRALVAQYLGAGNAEHVPSLLSSIEAMAMDAADKASYLQAVSEALAARAELDLDAILARGAERQANQQGRASSIAAHASEEAQSHGAPVADKDAGSRGAREADEDARSRGAPETNEDAGSRSAPKADEDARSRGAPEADEDARSRGAPDDDEDAGSRGSPTADAPAAGTVVGPDIATWRQRIARALIGGDPQLIIEHRLVLLNEHRGLLEGALRHYGRSEAGRQALVRGFPDALLADFLELLEPGVAPLAAAIRANPAPRQAADVDAGSLAWAAWRQRFWSQALQASMTAHVGFDTVLSALGGDDGKRAGPVARCWLAAIPAALRGIRNAVSGPAPDASQVATGEPLAATPYQGGIGADALSSLARALEAMTADSDSVLPPWLEAALAVPGSRARIVAALPDRLLTRLLLALRPGEHAVIQHSVDLVAAAYGRVHHGAPPARLWDAVFTYLFEHRRRYTEAALVDWLVAGVGSGLEERDRTELVRLVSDGVAEPAPRGHDEPVPTLRASGGASVQPANAGGGDGRAAAEPAEAGAGKGSYDEPASAPQHGAEPVPAEPLELLFLANAGMVLAAPYLPRLFAALALTEGGRFVDRAAAERAVHLLQFMVDARTSAPEYQLVLNKLLCGVATGVPIAAGIEITAHEQQTIEGLLQAMIANWKTIGSTSIDGLRDTFLRRKGSMQLRDDAWQLQVQPATFDMLLDRLPWSFSIIKYPWMERPVHVTWR